MLNIEELRASYWSKLFGTLRDSLIRMEKSGEVRDFKLEELFPQEFYASTETNVLSVWLDVSSGDGSWNLIRQDIQQAEPWSMSDEGIFYLDRATLSFPETAQRFAEKLSGKWHPKPM